jgi:hypothetical protein
MSSLYTSIHKAIKNLLKPILTAAGINFEHLLEKRIFEVLIFS